MHLQIVNDDGRIESAELSDDQAWALAQLCKRITFSDCRSNAVDEVEAYMMVDVTNKLRDTLARAGYNPR